ncbi:hypothetical protein VNO77_02562 [Canavalia gladiata]|uniref:Uncharacterized protein n=1 Tax=Canavalia gladiata TaxID=3824 RepID=A0AAN9MTZ8_CANGL
MLHTIVDDGVLRERRCSSRSDDGSFENDDVRKTACLEKTMGNDDNGGLEQSVRAGGRQWSVYTYEDDNGRIRLANEANSYFSVRNMFSISVQNFLSSLLIKNNLLFRGSQFLPIRSTWVWFFPLTC